MINLATSFICILHTVCHATFSCCRPKYSHSIDKVVCHNWVGDADSTHLRGLLYILYRTTVVGKTSLILHWTRFIVLELCILQWYVCVDECFTNVPVLHCPMWHYLCERISIHDCNLNYWNTHMRQSKKTMWHVKIGKITIMWETCYALNA